MAAAYAAFPRFVTSSAHKDRQKSQLPTISSVLQNIRGALQECWPHLPKDIARV